MCPGKLVILPVDQQGICDSDISILPCQSHEHCLILGLERNRVLLPFRPKSWRKTDIKICNLVFFTSLEFMHK